ncbi:ATP-binding protein [Chitinimonas lacunae]|uniref:histidine kinase n=1 Tax=Chitinimonas lacunae TaxID=1963018 RepID=A0ABV8MWE0_9NEIS
MRWTLRAKLAVALGGFGLILVGVMYLLATLGFEAGLRAHLDGVQSQMIETLRNRLVRDYPDREAWRHLADNPRSFERALEGVFPRSEPARGDASLERDQAARQYPFPPPRPFEAEGPPAEPRPGRGPGMRRPPPFPIVLLDAERRLLRGPSLPSEQLHLTEIRGRDGELLGYLGRPRLAQRLSSENDLFFANQQRRIMLWGSLAAALLALTLSWPLASLLLRPVRRIAAALDRLAARDYSVRLGGQGNDELGQLAADINRLAVALDEHGTSQRQWMADLAHELRTPLCVLQGELEALQDGVRHYDEATARELMLQVTRLSRLVDEIKELQLTDRAALRYRFERLDLSELVQDELDALAGRFRRADLDLLLFRRLDHAPCVGDAQRLGQLLLNLAENSLRYTDPGGQVRVTLSGDAQRLTLVWEDSAPGVPDNALPHLFERFYRVDASRQRATGGSGLGLAIVANIVAAHDGTVRAEHSLLGGLALVFEFPRERGG